MKIKCLFYFIIIKIKKITGSAYICVRRHTGTRQARKAESIARQFFIRNPFLFPNSRLKSNLLKVKISHLLHQFREKKFVIL